MKELEQKNEHNYFILYSALFYTYLQINTYFNMTFFKKEVAAKKWLS
mgnify:CR=1